jgi:two-component SAPR family response regulator
MKLLEVRAWDALAKNSCGADRMTNPARRVLLVEDDWMISIMLHDMIEELGFSVVGPIYNLQEGIESAELTEVDFAVLDYDLGNGTDAGPIADILTARHIPFAFATGHGREEIPDSFADIPLIYKPILPEELRRVISA